MITFRCWLPMMFTIYSPLLIVQCSVYCQLMPGTDIYKKLLHDKMNHNDCHLMLSLLCFKKRPAYSLHKAPRNEWIVCTAFDCTISKKIKVIQNNRSDTLYCFANPFKLKTIYKNLVIWVVFHITYRVWSPNESLI